MCLTFESLVYNFKQYKYNIGFEMFGFENTGPTYFFGA